MKDTVVIGSGGFSKQVIEMIEEINLIEQRYNLIGLIDDNKTVGTKILDYEVLGDTDYLNHCSRNKKIHGVIAISDGNVRMKIVEKLNDVIWINLIHPSAIISKYVEIGHGNIFCAGIVVNPELKVGNHCHINIGCTLGHDVIMEDYVTIMPGSRISGNVTLKSKSVVGTGTSIIQGLTIEKNVTLGAGAVVTKNTKANTLYIGIPAKEFTIFK